MASTQQGPERHRGNVVLLLEYRNVETKDSCPIAIAGTGRIEVWLTGRENAMTLNCAQLLELRTNRVSVDLSAEFSDLDR